MRPFLYNENKSAVRLLNTFNVNSYITDNSNDTDILKLDSINYFAPYHNGIQYNFIIRPDDAMKNADFTIVAGIKYLADTISDPITSPIINVRLNLRCESTPTFNITGNYSVAIYEAPISPETSIAETYARSHSPTAISLPGSINMTARTSSGITSFTPLYQPYIMSSGKTIFSIIRMYLIFVNRND